MGEPEFGMDDFGSVNDPTYPNVINIPMGKTDTHVESSKVALELPSRITLPSNPTLAVKARPWHT